MAMSTVEAGLVGSRRERTRRMLVDELRQQGSATRVELAKLTGLSRSAIAATVSELLADGVATENLPDRQTHTGRGRRSGVLRITPCSGYVVGIDFGHMHVRIAVADTAAQIMAEDVVALDVDNRAQDALDKADAMICALLDKAGLSRTDITATAAGVPGPLDVARRSVSSPTILHSWTTLDVPAELSRRLGTNVHLANDADMGATGEHRYGAAIGLSEFIYVKASHGIGASAVINGRCYRGASGLAGEIGHTWVAGNTQRCRCGKQGCLEATVSVPEVRAQLANTHLRLNPDTGRPTLAEVAGDPVGARVLSDAGRMVGTVIATGCNWLNPQSVILGGELGVAGQAFADGVSESLARYAQPASAEHVTVHVAKLGSRAEVMGSLAVAIDHCKLGA